MERGALGIVEADRVKESLLDRLGKVSEELEAGGLCEEEKGFLIQRGAYLLAELQKHGIFTCIGEGI